MYAGNNPISRIDPMGEDWTDAITSAGKAVSRAVDEVIGPPKVIRELQRVTSSPANYEVSMLDHFVDPLHLENAGPASQIVFGGGGFVMSTLSGNLPAAGVFYDQYNAGIGTWLTGRPQKALLTRGVEMALPDAGPWTRAGAEVVLGGGIGASPKLVSGLAAYGDDVLARFTEASSRNATRGLRPRSLGAERGSFGIGDEDLSGVVRESVDLGVDVTSKPRTVHQALTTGERFVGSGYREIAPGVFRSADGLRQFRMTGRDLTPTHGKIGPHVHFQKFDAAGKELKNIHTPLLDP